nr:ABC transporter ATP-binding protein [uncultured Acetatifactor sp.]
MKKNNPNFRAFKMLAGLNRRYFPVFFFSKLFARVSPFVNLWLSAEIVTALFNGAQKRKIWTLVIIALAGNLALALLNSVFERFRGHEETVLKQNEKRAFLKKTLSLDYDKLEDPAIRTLRRTIQENACINANGILRMRWMMEYMIESAIAIVLSLVFFAEMVVKMFSVPFRPGGMACLVGMVLSVAAIILYNRYSQKKMDSYERALNEALLDSNRFARGMPGHSKDIRLYRQYVHGEKVMVTNWLKMLREAFFKKANKDFHYTWIRFLFEFLLRTLAYLLVCMYCVANVFPVGSVIKYVGYLNQLLDSVVNLFYYITNLSSNTQFVETYLSFFDIPNEMYQGSLTTEKRSDRNYEVEFRNVSFKYPGSDEYALRNLSIKFKIGSRLAVVGRNGSGKTTFIKLLCRLYDPTEGEILLNGADIRKYSYSDYLSIFSVVFQDFRLFSFPLAQNVAVAEEYDSGKVIGCLEEAGFGQRLATLSQGIETPLYKDFDEKGVEISGGEAQKIALARALYKDAPFVILDEPTAALDPIAEAEIYAKFNDMVGDRTAIYISHRLSSCRFCDVIAVFDKGQIVQKGSHEELVGDAAGKYYELWNAQAQYYVTE